MIGIMLPLAVGVGRAVVNRVPVAAVEVAVPVKVVVIIDVDVAAAPVAITPPTTGNSRTDDDAGAPGQSHSRIVAGITVRIVGIGRRSVDNRGIIGWNVNGLRFRLLNNYDLLVVGRLSFDFLFLTGLESAFGLGFRAHPLDGIHHILLLREKGVPHIGCPLDIPSQSCHHIRHGGH